MLLPISPELMLLENLLGDGCDGSCALPLTPTLSQRERKNIKAR
jgi:hypothetical protein